MLKMVETRSSSNNNAEQSNNIYLSKEDVENIKASVIINVMEGLLDILEEIIPLIVDKSKILLNVNLEKQILLLLFPVRSLYVIIVKITFIVLYVKRWLKQEVVAIIMQFKVTISIYQKNT